MLPAVTCRMWSALQQVLTHSVASKHRQCHDSAGYGFATSSGCVGHGGDNLADQLIRSRCFTFEIVDTAPLEKLGSK